MFGHADSSCFAYLLDSMHPARPIEFNEGERKALCSAATIGIEVKALCQVLATQGFSFKLLGYAPSLADPTVQVPFYDILLSSVQ